VFHKRINSNEPEMENIYYMMRILLYEKLDSKKKNIFLTD